MADVFDNDRFRKLLRAYPAKAVEVLHQRFHRRLLSIAFYFTRDQQSAEDIVQETFMHVWENYLALSEPHRVPIEFYLIRVTRNRSITYFHQLLRTSKKMLKYHRHIYEQNTSNNVIEQHIMQEELKVVIRQLLDTFPRREKECLLLKVDDELTNSEIATRLGVSVKAVERSVTSANKRLRRFGIRYRNNFEVM